MRYINPRLTLTLTLALRQLRAPIISRCTRQLPTVACTSCDDSKIRLCCPFGQLSK